VPFHSRKIDTVNGPFNALSERLCDVHFLRFGNVFVCQGPEQNHLSAEKCTRCRMRPRFTLDVLIARSCQWASTTCSSRLCVLVALHFTFCATTHHGPSVPCHSRVDNSTVCLIRSLMAMSCMVCGINDRCRQGDDLRPSRGTFKAAMWNIGAKAQGAEPSHNPNQSTRGVSRSLKRKLRFRFINCHVTGTPK